MSNNKRQVAPHMTTPAYTATPAVPIPAAREARVYNPLRVRGTLERSSTTGLNKKKEKPSSKVANTVFKKTFENMESNQVVEFVGVVSAIFKCKDVYLRLVNTAEHQDSTMHESDIDQLVTAGFENQVVELVGSMPPNIFVPLSYEESNDAYIVKFKAGQPEVLDPLKDEEAEYGYRTGDYVRVVAKTATWGGWKGDASNPMAEKLKDSVGVSLYIRSIELLTE
jgi:hypothetical protein